MGDHIFACHHSRGEDLPHIVDLWNDGMTPYLKVCVSIFEMFLPTQIPAGIFLPTIAIGACLGRAVGLLTYVLVTASWRNLCN